MNSTTYSDTPRRGRRSAQWISLGVLLMITLGMALLGRIEPMTTAIALAVTGVCTAGVLAMAWLLRDNSPYPRWSWWTTAALLGSALPLTVPFARDPAAWIQDVRVSAWMLPWFLLVMATGERSRTGVCAPGARAGWILVGTGALFTVILLSANVIGDWLKGR